MSSKNISIRLDDETIKTLRECGSIEKLSTKIQNILKNHISSEFIRESHWMPHPIDTYRIFFDNMDEKQIDNYISILIHEYEKYSIFSQQKIGNIGCLIDFGNLVSGPGGLVKKVREHDSIIEYFTEHNLGRNTSKIIYSFYINIGKLIDYVIIDETIEDNFVSFKLMKKKS